MLKITKANPMKCVATQSETMQLISQRLIILASLQFNYKTVTRITNLWFKGVGEMVDGGLTQKSCRRMSAILLKAEGKARKAALGGDLIAMEFYSGLISIHQSMSLLIPAGGNEGNKEWPPG